MTDKGLSYAIGASVLLHGLAIGFGATGKVPAQEAPRLLEARLVREVIPEKRPEAPRVEAPPRHVKPTSPRPMKAPERHEPVAAPQPRLVAEARSAQPAPAIQTTSAATVAPSVAHAPALSAPAVSSLAPAAPATSGASFSPPSFGASYLDNPKPGYPLMARRRGLEGTVRLDVRVSAEGIPTSVKLKESAGHESLDEAAIIAVWHWRFVPARRAGESVEASVVVPVRFRLSGEDAG